MADKTTADLLGMLAQQGWQPAGNGVGLLGKILGAMGLDASGQRAQQSWGDAAKATAHDVAHLPDTMK